MCISCIDEPNSNLYKNKGIANELPELYIKSSATALGFTPWSNLYFSQRQCKRTNFSA